VLHLRDVSPGVTASHGEWLVWGLLDDPCPRCDGVQCVASPADSRPQPVSAAVACLQDCGLTLVTDLPMASQFLLGDRYALLMERTSVERASVAVADAIQILGLALGARGGEVRVGPTAEPAVRVVDAGSSRVDVPVPEGYRSVSWIREYEAELIVSAYKARESFELKNDAGQPIFRATYFGDSTPEPVKFKANVEAVRVRKNGVRVVGWIRPEEAKAVLDANRDRRDVEFRHVRHGHGGLVQFFPEASEAARTYLSTTRLLRKS